MSTGHRSTLKQVNKPFKGAVGSSKREQKRQNKGKVQGETPRVGVKFQDKAGAKDKRRNLAKQIQTQKRQEALDKKRYGHGAPRLVAIIPLGEKANPVAAASLLLAGSGIENHPAINFGSQVTAVVGKFKSRVTFHLPPRELIPIIDIAKAADVIVFAIDAEEGVTDTGNAILHQIFAQGMPAVIGVVTGLEGVAMKRRNDVKKAATAVFQSQFAEEPRICPLDTLEDAEQVVRFICTQKLREIWREGSPYLIAEKLNWQPLPGNAEFGTLQLAGYLRGNKLDVNKLIHITDVGDFQLEKIEIPIDPYPFNPRNDPSNAMSDAPSSNYFAPDENQESLQSQNTPDETANEQTFPTERELAEAEKQRIKKRRVPKGTSAYQATWIPDEDGDEEDDGSNHDDGDEDMKDEDDQEGSGEEEEAEEGDGDDAMEDEEFPKLIPGGKKKAPINDDGSDISDDDAASIAPGGRVKSGDKSLKEQADDDVMWPDQVDTPEDEPARFKFAKYRGLKSLRTSPWDPKLALPADYGRIFQFANFRRTQKRILHSHNGVAAGTYVILHLKEVHKDAFATRRADWPVVVSGLMSHEQKFSVVNLQLTKVPSYTDIIKNKEELLFQVGFRRYKANPVFSENTHGTTKFKMERFLHDNRTSVASIYAPIAYPPMPVMVWKQLPNSNIQLAATGGVLSIDPDRIILKKIVLVGKALKIRKRRAVIREMFFNPEDVEYFSPVELHTKYGKVGQILEAVGTHGKMKCLFDSPISHQDTVCMNLYARTYPKWAQVPTPSRLNADNGAAAAAAVPQ